MRRDRWTSRLATTAGRKETAMNLALAHVLAATGAGGHVQYLDDQTFADATYSAQVQELVEQQGLRFGPCHLVMVDRQASPPEIVYRAATLHLVVQLDGQEAILYRQGQDDRLDWPHRTQRLIDARPAEDRRASIRPGDIVVTHRGRLLDGGTLELDVLDLAAAGRPDHPERLRAEVLPRIEAIYGESAAGAAAEA
jgi:hypothetical protein